MSYYPIAPDLVVLIGVRPLLSATGLALIVAGSWQMQRNKPVTTIKEQELTTTSSTTIVPTRSQSSAVAANDLSEYDDCGDEGNNNIPMGEYSQMPDSLKITVSHSMDDDSELPRSYRSPRNIVCCSTLEIPFRSLLVSLVGWFFFGLSCWASANHYNWQTLDGGTPIVCFIVCLLIACHMIFKMIFQKYDSLELILLQDDLDPPTCSADLHADEEQQYYESSGGDIPASPTATTGAITTTITLGQIHGVVRLLLLVLLASLLGSMNASISGVVASFGGLFMGVAPFFHSETTVFHLQGPLITIGAFFLWIGMNAIVAEPTGYFLPIYKGSCVILASLGATALICIMWMVGYAQETDPTHRSAIGFRKWYFGAIWEIRLLLCAGWTLLGSAIFLPFVYSVAWSTMIFLLFVVLGYSMGMWYEFMVCKKLAQSSVVEFMFTQAQKWGRIAATTLLLIVVFMSASANYHTRVSCIVLAFMGGCAFVVGQIMMLNDSTIVGANYLQPYSYGSLLTTIGLILLAWAITLRTP
jgi:hypothetical protein